MLNPAIFREYDIRGIADTDLPNEAARKIGLAYGTFLRQKGKKNVAVGRDGRVSSPRIREVMIEALLDCGLDVIDVGIVTTPMLYFANVYGKKDAGIMITASHNPKEFNGFKMCMGKETLFGEQIRGLLKIAEAGNFESGRGKVSTWDVLPEYVAYLKERFSYSKDLKIVVDCGNGAASVVAASLFRELGCDVTDLYCKLDGTFPNHFPDPTEEHNLIDLIKTVKQTKARVGIAFDGDADRLGAVDENGQLIFGDRLLYLFAVDMLTRQKGATVIGDVKCSNLLFEQIKLNGGNPIMAKTGHSLIKAKIRETNALLAGEMSGHFFFGENYFGYDDGVFAACRLLDILNKSGKKLSELLAAFPKTYSTPEIRVDCADDKKFAVVEKAVRDFKKIYDVIDIDGVRINFPDGWGLVRASNTQAALVMRFEATTEARLQEIRSLVENKIKELS